MCVGARSCAWASWLAITQAQAMFNRAINRQQITRGGKWSWYFIGLPDWRGRGRILASLPHGLVRRAFVPG